MGWLEEARDRRSRGSNSERKAAVSQPGGGGRSIEEGEVELIRRAAREGEPLDLSPPGQGKRVDHVRQEVPVRRSSRGERASRRGYAEGEGLECAEGAVRGSRDGDRGSVARRERPRELRKEMNDVGYAPESQAGKKTIHLLRV